MKIIASKRIGSAKGNGNDVVQNLQTQDLLDRLVEFSDSPGSRAFYQKAVSVLGVGLVEEALGEVRYRAAVGGVNHMARYLTRVLSDWMEGRRASKSN